MHNGQPPARTFVILSRLFVNDELKVLIEFHGTAQKHFYTVSRFEQGARTDVDGQFPSLEDAKAAA